MKNRAIHLKRLSIDTDLLYFLTTRSYTSSGPYSVRYFSKYLGRDWGDKVDWYMIASKVEKRSTKWFLKQSFKTKNRRDKWSKVIGHNCSLTNKCIQILIETSIFDKL